MDWTPYEKLFVSRVPKDGVILVVGRWCHFSFHRMPEFLKKYPNLRLIDADKTKKVFPGLQGYPTPYKVENGKLTML